MYRGGGLRYYGGVTNGEMTMNLQEIDRILNTIEDEFFTVQFEKKDGTERTMNCRKGVTKHLKGGESTIKNNPDLVSVYDVQAKAYRCFAKSRLKRIKANGVEYTFSE